MYLCSIAYLPIQEYLIQIWRFLSQYQRFKITISYVFKKKEKNIIKHASPTDFSIKRIVELLFSRKSLEKDGKYLLNPSPEELIESELDLVVAGTKDAVLLVESETSGLTEKEMSRAGL